MLYICAMLDGKGSKTTHVKISPPKISVYVDQMREKLKITRTEFAFKMGINKDIYRRRLSSPDGFTELELTRALKELSLEMEIKLKIE